MSIDLFGNIIGYCGMFILIYAFFLIQKEKTNMLVYNILNLMASLLLMISLFIHINMASLTLEVFWILCSLYGIFKVLKKKKNTETN